MRIRPNLVVAALLVTLGPLPALGQSAGSAGSAAAPPSKGVPATALVAEIAEADYRGDRARLLALFHRLQPGAPTPHEAARLHYWRGFARWRRAINGVNESPLPDDLRDDLQTAAREFEAAISADPAFEDARVALLSAVGIQLFLKQGDPAEMQPLLDRLMPMVQALQAAPQYNPRTIWVLGQAEWRTNPDWPRDRILLQQERVIASYLRGLDLARTSRAPTGALDPRWGEPELLMSLAWSHLNKAVPDLTAAERCAREALALVPHWHYVRDILLPQIERARGK